MGRVLAELFESTGQLDAQAIVLRMLVATALAAFIYLSYMISHEGSIYSKKFNVSLVGMTEITTAVMIVIGNNIVLSLGMVGALSIVRFRTAIKDSRDTIYIFWTIVVGIWCGAGDFLVASVGSAFIFAVLFIMGRIKNDNRVLLILRTHRANESKVESLFFRHFTHKANLRVKNSTENSVEFIYEISKKMLDKVNKNSTDKSFSDLVYEIGHVDYFNMVMQNDEISG